MNTINVTTNHYSSKSTANGKLTATTATATMTAKYIRTSPPTSTGSNSNNHKAEVEENVLKTSNVKMKKGKDVFSHAREERRRRQHRRVKQLSTLEGMEIEEWRVQNNCHYPQQSQLQDVTNKRSSDRQVKRQSPSSSPPSKHNAMNDAGEVEHEEDEDEDGISKFGGRFNPRSLFRLMSNNSSRRSQSSNDEAAETEAENGEGTTRHRSSSRRETTTKSSPLRYVSTAWAAWEKFILFYTKVFLGPTT